MALVAALVKDRDESKSVNAPVAILFALSVLINLAPGNYLNRVAMFYSAHFVSSLLTLAALFALWWQDREIEAGASDSIPGSVSSA
jgi:hypothetical protein